jgi:hypothetical protein
MADNKNKHRPPRSRCVAIVDSGGVPRCITWVERIIRKEEEAIAARAEMDTESNAKSSGTQAYLPKKEKEHIGYG